MVLNRSGLTAEEGGVLPGAYDPHALALAHELTESQHLAPSPRNVAVVARCARQVVIGVVAVASGALRVAPCAAKAQQPGAQSPERQSDAEYDIARDLFQKGNPRVALDHIQKALPRLNEENDKAHHLKAAILLCVLLGPGLVRRPGLQARRG